MQKPQRDKNDTTKNTKKKSSKRKKKNTPWKRNCPKCNKVLYYSSKYNLYKAVNKNSKCNGCKNLKYNLIKNENNLYERKCPICNKIYYFITKSGIVQAIIKNKKCRSCIKIGNRATDKTRQFMSLMRRGKNNSNYGNRGKQNPIYGKNNPSKHPDVRKKKSIAMKKYYKNHPEAKLALSNRVSGENNPSKRPDVRKKMRIAAIKRINQTFGQIAPNYNFVPIPIFNEICRILDWRGMHANNGGEYYIKELGYWPDFYNSKDNIIIEYDEKT